MPRQHPRRRLLAALGAGAGAATAGCLSRLGLAGTGYLQLKAIDVRWEHRGTTWSDDVLWFVHERDEGTIRGRYDPRYAGDAVDAPDDIAVDDALHDRLTREFAGVRYVVGVCGDHFGGSRGSYGCTNAETGRADFNRVQLDDRAEVLERGARLDVVDVYPDAYDVGIDEVREFDFDALHDDDGR